MNEAKTTPADPIDDLARRAAEAGPAPGVYIMKDAGGEIIYVGKAANLKKRLASYFSRKAGTDPKTAMLIGKIASFETILTDTENEAFILESTLIKKHKPRYNVVLKDDKRYPLLRMDIKNPFPVLTIVRKRQDDGALYFGPFSSAGSVRKTLRMIKHVFKLRQCKTSNFKNRKRPCLNYQMGMCYGPCCLDVDPDIYNKGVREVAMFLEGRLPELIRKLKTEMNEAAERLQFETAAALRDKLFAVEKTLEKQAMVVRDQKDRDVIALESAYEASVISVLSVRSGLLIETRQFGFNASLAADHEIIGSFMRQYYEKTPSIPDEILVSALPEDAEMISEHLKSLKAKKVSILRPQRGEKLTILKTALKNAEQELERRMISAAKNQELLERLKDRLNMARTPERIECFDNSNISGTQAVSGMVVFQDGQPDKSSYRKYVIKTVTEHDDYAYMAEVLGRRFGKGEDSNPYPDLLMVDGGKGQLSIAASVIRELGVEGRFDIVGIAKKNAARGETADKIYKPGMSNPVIFGRDADLLLFLQRVRDEAHRFAIAFHRNRRRTTGKGSVLDSIQGVGKKRKSALIRHFGSIKRIRSASVEEIAAVPGISRSVAESVRAALNPPENHESDQPIDKPGSEIVRPGGLSESSGE